MKRRQSRFSLPGASYSQFSRSEDIRPNDCGDCKLGRAVIPRPLNKRSCPMRVVTLESTFR